MSVYMVAQISINDKTVFRDYHDAIFDFFEQKNVDVLAIDDCPAVVEGEDKGRRMVILRFDTAEEYYALWKSKELQDIAQLRFDSSESRINLLQERNIQL